MLVIGLTGGIGVGKSTVSDYLRRKKYVVIDADKIAHELLESDSGILPEIRKLLGCKVFSSDGNLDRKAVAALIFQNPQKKKSYEELTTKKVVEIINNQLNDLRNRNECGIIFVDAPLLFESGADKLTQIVWLVDADKEVRIKRIISRDNTTRIDVLKRIDNQLSSEAKRQLSQEVIDNSYGKEVLYRQIDKLLDKYDTTNRKENI